VGAQAASQKREVEHQGRVTEHQLAEVNHHVATGFDGAGERPAPVSLGRPILISSTAQDGGVGIEFDDGGNLQNPAGRRKGNGHSMRANGLGQTDEVAQPPTLLAMATVEAVTDALRDVIDPELGLDFVELGLIYDVEVEGGTVRVTYTLTSPGCPIGPQVSEQIEEFVSELEGVEEVQPTMTFSPPWTPDRMSEDAKFALGF
jgi:metal-sulfur cluster biosynthetic enzyme